MYLQHHSLPNYDYVHSRQMDLDVLANFTLANSTETNTAPVVLHILCIELDWL
jgi:hypothetical protein